MCVGGCAWETFFHSIFAILTHAIIFEVDFENDPTGLAWQFRSSFLTHSLSDDEQS